VGLTRARRNLDLVSCFGPQHLEAATLENGARLLADIVREVNAPVREKGSQSTTEPMLRDLAERLRHRGLAVELGYGGDISLVASHGRVAVAVETDAVLSRGTLRESLRLRPAALRRLGWHYVRVHTFELFADPEAVAARIAGIAGLSSAVTMEVETLDAASMGDASMDAASMVDASTGSAQGPVEAHAALSATEAIDAAIESVTPIDAAPGYVARFADEEPLAAPVRALPVDHSEDDVLTAPLDVPHVDVPLIEVPSIDAPQIDVPQIDVPQVDAAERPVPRQDALPRRASDDIPRADALDDE
jgi:hypothetical protein